MRVAKAFFHTIGWEATKNSAQHKAATKNTFVQSIIRRKFSKNSRKTVPGINFSIDYWRSFSGCLLLADVYDLVTSVVDCEHLSIFKDIFIANLFFLRKVAFMVPGRKLKQGLWGFWFDLD